MTHTTDTKTLAMISYEIDAFRLKAKAELAMDAIGRDPNPWRGASDTLRALEADRARLILEEHGRRLVALLDEREQLRQKIDDALEPQLRALLAELADMEHDPHAAQRAALRAKITSLTAFGPSNPDVVRLRAQYASIEETVVQRWNNAEAVANGLGWGGHYRNYKAWVLSNRPKSARNSSDAPVTQHHIISGMAPGASVWPPAVLFETDAEREQVKKYVENPRRIADVQEQLQNANARIRAIEATNPEIASIP